MGKRGEIPITMAKTAPLASQGKIKNGKTDNGIVISSIVLVSVAMDKTGIGGWGKKFRKGNGIL